MIDLEIKSAVEKHAARELLENPIFVLAAQGKMTAAQVKLYLASVLYLIQHTPVYLSLAARVSEERGLGDLHRFFVEKIGEEVGHDAWAEEGIKKLDAQAEVSPHQVPPARAMQDLVGYLRSIIETDPHLYLPYVFLAEYFTVLVGPTFVQNLQKKCGIAAECMTVIGNHAELDKGHVLHDIEFFRSAVPTDYSARFDEVIETAMGYYRDFGQEVGGAHVANH